MRYQIDDPERHRKPGERLGDWVLRVFGDEIKADPDWLDAEKLRAHALGVSLQEREK